MTAAIFAVAIAAATVVLVIPIQSLNRPIHEGDVATRTLEAARDRTFESEGLTEAARRRAADGIADVPLPLDPAQRQQQVDRLTRYLDQVQLIATRSDSRQAKIDQLAQIQTPAPVTNAARLALIEIDRSSWDAFTQKASKAMADVHNKPLLQADISPRIDEYLASQSATLTAPEISTIGALLRAFVTPTFQVDTAATQAKRDQARDNVSPVVVTYTRGQVIVNESNG